MGKLIKISGPVVVADGMHGAQINEVVKVGKEELNGEVIALEGEKATIQVYEETTGLRPGEEVSGTGLSLSVELGPGLLSSVFDGIQRPLDKIRQESGDFIARGISINALDRKKEWEFHAKAKKGQKVQEGDVLGIVKEFNLDHKILVPKGVNGIVASIKSGKFAIEDVVAEVGKHKVSMMQKWPVRIPRLFAEKLVLDEPLVTGKRILDTLFPVAKGGAAAIPGPFGSGKCVTGETPVYLANGRTITMGQIFETARRGRKIATEFKEEYFYELVNPIKVLSKKADELVEINCRYFFRGKSNKILRIKLATGKFVEVTPIHKLFQVESGVVDEVEAQNLQLGDLIISIANLQSQNMYVMHSNEQLQLNKLGHSVFASDKIVEIEEVSGDFEVFDLVVPETHNFVGGFNGPTLLHNTVNQTDLAKYSDADVIVYVGCGERGNEMTEVLVTFPKLIDPRNKQPLMQRTVLVANTSNMPVAAREASIYTGITIAEYYRDMGYHVALMADSTSRWAEAMREISGRMEEMPGEEGYPAYLAKKLAEFYERAGKVKCLGSDKRVGSVTVVGAVSPAGGDISEPVSQSTLRVTKVFWALDSALSRRRHFPAINWLKSYSLYVEDLSSWYAEKVDSNFERQRSTAMGLLQKEAELQNIVQLVGPDALPEKERIVLDVAKMLREDFLQQNSFDEVDAYSTPKKQFAILKAILTYYEKATSALDLEVSFEKIVSMPEKQRIAKLKNLKEGADFEKEVKEVIHSLEKAFSK